MTFAALLKRSLAFYRASNVAVMAGVAIAVSVLTGALLVGASVRASLRRLALERLGNTVTVVSSASPIRDGIISGAPLLALDGIVSHQSSGRRAAGVAVYGVDERFWRFHGVEPIPLGPRQAAASQALIDELGAESNDVLVIKVEKPAAIPAESLHGRKEDPAATMIVRLRGAASREQMGEFSLRPQQGAVKAIFVPLKIAGAPNTALSTQSEASVKQDIQRNFRIEDLGYKLRGAHLHHASGLLPDGGVAPAIAAAEARRVQATGALTYLANTLRIGQREVPYSLVAALDAAQALVPAASRLSGTAATPNDDAIILNDWAAAALSAKPGDKLEMEYYLWRSDGRLTTEKASFTVHAIVPISGLAADRDLTPEYPGITDSENVSDWDPPFPLELKRVRPADEDYWHKYRTTPKAFIPLKRGRELWSSRWGSLTSIRFERDPGPEFAAAMRSRLDPFANGFTVTDIRERSLEASRGATDFGEYFIYFSFFLVVSALLLAGLFFRLGVEQRADQVGLLRAVGFPPKQVRRGFLAEGAILSLAGGLFGALGAAAYAGLILYGLGTWWIEAVGTRELGLHVPAGALAAGVSGGILAALAAVAWTLRGLARITPRTLLAGGGNDDLSGSFKSRARWTAIIAALLAAALLAAGASDAIPAAAGFFGAGTFVLIATLAALRAVLAASVRFPVRAILPLALRNAAHRPGRTVLCAALIASATFLIVSVETFRRDPGVEALDRKSGTGGFTLMGESVRPLYHDLNTADGKAALNLDTVDASVRFTPFRLRPGDDASCLNLYQPRNPRILGAPAAFLKEARFSFATAESAGVNPWAQLDGEREDGAIPAIADANSMTYVLHKKLGEEITVEGSKGQPVRLRLVAALKDSILQGELLISERHFLKAFPDIQGYRVFLLDAQLTEAEKVTSEIESALSDHGMDLVSTGQKLAGFHRVENTYLSTFQTLGALGLLLGTAGLAAILFRNVLERKRELALLTAVGFERRKLSRLILSENLLMLLWGLGSGLLAAAIAVAPAISARGAQFAPLNIALLLAAVLFTGLTASVIAVRRAGLD